jgi:hypothetical protein
MVARDKLFDVPKRDVILELEEIGKNCQNSS